MPFLGYDSSRTEGTPEPTLPDPPGALLRLFSFGNFFSLFIFSLFNNTIMPNTPFTYSAVFNSFILMPTTPNHYIH